MREGDRWHCWSTSQRGRAWPGQLGDSASFSWPLNTDTHLERFWWRQRATKKEGRRWAGKKIEMPLVVSDSGWVRSELRKEIINPMSSSSFNSCSWQDMLTTALRLDLWFKVLTGLRNDETRSWDLVEIFFWSRGRFPPLNACIKFQRNWKVT